MGKCKSLTYFLLLNYVVFFIFFETQTPRDEIFIKRYDKCLEMI